MITMTSGDTQPTPDWAVRHALERVRPALTEGLDAAQVDWATRAYESAVLPYHLRTSPAAPDDQRRRIAEAVAQEIRDSVAGLSPEEKWARIVREYYAAALLPLSDAAFRLAQRTYRDGAAGAQESQEADQLRRWVDELAERMGREAPDAREALAHTLSETLLDLEYAQRPSNVVSFRLNARMEEESARRG
jgi:hypothetical protein